MNFVFIDSTNNYPLCFSAGNSKIEYMSRALVKLGHNVLVINSRSGYSDKTLKGDRDGIRYILFKKGNFFQYMKNIISQCKLLREQRGENDNFVILASTFSGLLFLDIFYCKLIGYKVLFLFHEMRTTIRSHKSFVYQIDAWLVDHVTGYVVNGILPISHYINDYSRGFNKPMFMLPILSDYPPQINIAKRKNACFSFLYCGSIGYMDAIDMIIKANPLIECNGVEIKLVLYGEKNKIENLRKYISLIKYNNIEILQDLSKEDLFSLYAEASGLFIPLDPNNVQDKVRFSQKIAEYISTKTPIITVNVGEIPYYFRNKESAIIMEEFSPQSLAESINYIINNKESAMKIGKNGYKVGEKYFSAEVVMKDFEDFISLTYSAKHK